MKLFLCFYLCAALVGLNLCYADSPLDVTKNEKAEFVEHLGLYEVLRLTPGKKNKYKYVPSAMCFGNFFKSSELTFVRWVELFKINGDLYIAFDPTELDRPLSKEKNCSENRCLLFEKASGDEFIRKIKSGGIHYEKTETLRMRKNNDEWLFSYNQDDSVFFVFGTKSPEEKPQETCRLVPIK